MGKEFDLTLIKQNTPSPKPQTIFRPQNPKAPFPYKQEEVSFKNNKEGNVLAGTLTIPQGKGKFPAIVLVSGPGSQDRKQLTHS